MMSTMKELTMNTCIGVATALTGMTLALGACGQIGSARTGSSAVSPGSPAPLPEPPASLSAPAASHDYAPIPAWANHPAPGTDAQVALAADAKAQAVAQSNSGSRPAA
jgi:uncharacterized iron-regulated membrane protein